MSKKKLTSSDLFRIALNKLLRENSVTQQELANNVGVTGHYISNISTGKRSASRKKLLIIKSAENLYAILSGMTLKAVYLILKALLIHTIICI